MDCFYFSQGFFFNKSNANEISYTQLYHQLQSIIDSSYLAIIAADTKGVITHFNHAAERLLDYKASEMIGKNTPAVFHDKQEVVEHAKRLSKQLGRTINPGFETFVAGLETIDHHQNEWTYISKYGRRFPVLLSVTALKEKGVIYGYMGIALDISERKAVEKMKNEFVSVVSHELRTPLTSIHASLGVLLSMKLKEDEKAKQLLEIARKNSLRLISLINDILDLDKLETEQVQIKLCTLNILELLEESIQLALPVAEQNQLNIRIEDKLSKHEIKTSHDRLIQVLTNLLSNAMKHSPPLGKIRLKLFEKGEFICLEVYDQGAGVPKGCEKNLFKKFSQIDSSVNRKTQGTGLGLYISKLILNRLGGKIMYRRVKNETCFQLLLKKDVTLNGE